MEKLRKDDAKDNIKKYENQLVLDELSERTIKKYVVDVEQWLNDMPVITIYRKDLFFVEIKKDKLLQMELYGEA